MSDDRTYDNGSDEYCGSQDNITCPHCEIDLEGYIDSEDLPWEDQEVTEIECHACGEYFQVRAAATIEFYVSKPDTEY